MKIWKGLLLGAFVGTAFAQSVPAVQMQSPDGHYLAVAITTSSGSAIVMHDLVYDKKNGGGSTLVIPVNKSPIVSITFSSDSQKMSTKEVNGAESVWQIDRGGAATLLSTSPAAP